MTSQVTVVVPNYNHARFLGRRLDSILAQTFVDTEVIVLDDASTDDSCDVISRYTDDPRVTFIPNATNSGSPFIQWNRGVSAAHGKYVWIAESDDYAEPEFLATLVPMLEKNRDCVLAYCQSRRVDEESRLLGTMADVWDPNLDPARWAQDFVNNGPDECARYLVWKNTVPNASAAVFCRSAFVRAGGAPEGMRLCGDWFLWSQLLRFGSVAYTANQLNSFRQHPASVRAATSWYLHMREQWITQTSILRTMKVPSKTKRRLARAVVGQMLDQILPAPASERRRIFRECWPAAAPIFRRAPIAAAQELGHRLAGGIRKRLKPPGT